MRNVNAAGEIYFVDSIITAYGQIETFDNGFIPFI